MSVTEMHCSGRVAVKPAAGRTLHKPMHEPKTYTQQLQELQQPGMLIFICFSLLYCWWRNHSIFL